MDSTDLIQNKLENSTKPFSSEIDETRLSVVSRLQEAVNEELFSDSDSSDELSSAQQDKKPVADENALGAANESESRLLWPKGTIKTTEIAMGGLKVKVRTDATPASLKQIRELVDEKFSEFSAKLNKGVSTHQMAVLVAFNLAEELLKERERNRIQKKKTVEWAERLLSRVESHMANNT